MRKSYTPPKEAERRIFILPTPDSPEEILRKIREYARGSLPDELRVEHLNFFHDPVTPAEITTEFTFVRNVPFGSAQSRLLLQNLVHAIGEAYPGAICMEQGTEIKRER